MEQEMVSVRLKGETLERFKEYQQDDSKTQAARELIKSGLDTEQLGFVNQWLPVLLSLMFFLSVLSYLAYGTVDVVGVVSAFVAAGLGWILGVLFTPIARRLSVRVWNGAVVRVTKFAR